MKAYIEVFCVPHNPLSWFYTALVCFLPVSYIMRVEISLPCLPVSGLWNSTAVRLLVRWIDHAQSHFIEYVTFRHGYIYLNRETSKPASCDTSPPIWPYLLILPKEFCQLEIMHLNICIYGGCSHSDYHTFSLIALVFMLKSPGLCYHICFCLHLAGALSGASIYFTLVLVSCLIK